MKSERTMRLNMGLKVEMSTYELAIIGLGPAGIFTLASLPESILSTTIVIEKACIGGDIATQYGAVVANITKAEIIQTFRTIPRWANTTYPELDAYQDNQAPPLALVGKILRRFIMPDLQKAHLHTCELTALTTTPTQRWQLETTAGMFEAQTIVLCMGAKPKTLNLPAPTIPLSVAFTSQLAHFVNPDDSTHPIVVFGTSHSGVLVLKELYTLGCRQVYAVYKGTEPFRIADAPQAEGLKQDAAMIAKEIQQKAWGINTPTLLSYNDFSTLYRLIHKAQAVIYAIGFEPRSIPLPEQTPNLFQIGYCKPNLSWVDIGFAGFIRQAQDFARLMEKTLPAQ